MPTGSQSLMGRTVGKVLTDSKGCVDNHYMETATFPNSKCSSCDYEAGENNGWFGTDSRCLDCRSDDHRAEHGWTPENSLS